MNVAFLLHLYQPPTQPESVTRQIFSSCYNPLVKLIKNNPDIKITLNLPLSLLESLEKCGYEAWIKDIRDLTEADRLEITGTAAYHPLLTKLPEKFVIEQIVLNEYGLGYYLGSRQGFEGEPSILIKNVRGLFPPELAINDQVLHIASDLGYEWVVADRCVVPETADSTFSDNIYKVAGNSALVVVRDAEISNSLSFKRDPEPDDVHEKIMARLRTGVSPVVALDGEVFGHHNENGIFLLEALFGKLRGEGVSLVTVSELIFGLPVTNTDHIQESNWSEAVCTSESSGLYKLWNNENNKVQQNLWEILHSILDSYEKLPGVKNADGQENVPLWNFKSLKNVPKELLKEIELNIMVNKSLHSDQFWWASGEKVYDKVLHSPIMVSAALNLYREIAARIGEPTLIKFVDDKCTVVEKALEQE